MFFIFFVSRRGVTFLNGFTWEVVIIGRFLFVFRRRKLNIRDVRI